ncbi:MAG: hypothetical protein NZO16_01990 [Deltaproteobacteria bacterium]|nr:hypothetical protein [Deltaproteobacteria bacterium]
MFKDLFRKFWSKHSIYFIGAIGLFGLIVACQRGESPTQGDENQQKTQESESGAGQASNELMPEEENQGMGSGQNDAGMTDGTESSDVETLDGEMNPDNIMGPEPADNAPMPSEPSN